MENSDIVRSLVLGQRNIDQMKGEIAEVVGLAFRLLSLASIRPKEPLEYETETCLWRVSSKEESDNLGRFHTPVVECFRKIQSNKRLSRIFNFHHRESLVLGDVEDVYDSLGTLMWGVTGLLPPQTQKDYLQPLVRASLKKL